MVENFIAQKDLQVLDTSLSRRQLIKGVRNLGLLMATPSLLTLSSKVFASIPEKSLNVYNTHTGESLKKCTFWLDGKLNVEAMAELNRLFRDHRTNQECTMDPNLMHLIHNILEKTGSQQMIHLISGYRSPKTNTMLRKKSCGVASNSQHLTGKAADIMLPDRTMKQVQQAAKSLKAGGVGRYAQFVHIDTGRVRYWGPA